MTLEEIRTQKALALLEVKEAEDKATHLEKEREAFARELRSFASLIERMPDGILGTFIENYGHLTAAAAYEILVKLEAAKKQLIHAVAKKDEFKL